MSIISGKPYKIVNKQVALALDLSKEDHKSILGEDVVHGDVKKQTWIIEFLHGGGEVLIKSRENDGLYIGFDGPAKVEQKLIAVHRDHAKVWVLEREHAAPDYKFGLKGTDFVIEFPEHNLHPGTHAQLGVPFLVAPHQIWVVTLVK